MLIRGVRRAKKTTTNWLSACVAVILFAASLAQMPGEAHAQAQGVSGGFIELTDVLFAEGDRIFGPGETITISGSVPRIPKMMCGSGNGEGRFDFFPTADLYVIKDTDAPPFQLTDVLGSPNRVIGTSSRGAFVEETVAITLPLGNLPAGTYDVVMDQCENGIFDPRWDIHLGAGRGFAFKVFLPEKPGEIDLHPLKLAAKNYFLVLDGFGVPEDIDTGVPQEVPGFCRDMTNVVEVGKTIKQVADELGDAAGVAIEMCNDLSAHYKGLVADPPDPNFTAFAELGAIPHVFFSSASAFERALLRVSNIIVEQEALTEAFLTTLERVQGAQEADDHEFLSLQLRHLSKFINLLTGPGGNLLRFFGALDALDRAVMNDPALAAEPDVVAFLAQSAEMRRAIGGLIRPLSTTFVKNPSDPDKALPIGLQAWIVTYLGLDPLLSFAGLSSIAEFRAASGLPPIAFQHPEAATTGPYTAPPDRTVSFDAGPSSDPNSEPLSYAWDLDADGLFDDSAAQLVQRPFAEPGTRLVGLKVTDLSGNSDVAYVQLKIGDMTIEDIVTIQHQPRNLRRIAPDGTVTTIANNVIPISATSPGALQLDVNGDIFTLLSSRGRSSGAPFLYHLDPAGNLLNSLSEAQLEALIGRDIGDTYDLLLDGRGDLLMTANERDPAIPPHIGPLMILRLNRGLDRASVLADGIRRSNGSLPSLALDPHGRIVIADLTEPDAVVNPNWLGRFGISAFDPADGSITRIVPASNALLPNGQGQTVEHLFGGVRLALPHFGGDRSGGGIAVDRNGDYFLGAGLTGLPIDLWRIPIPARVSTLFDFTGRPGAGPGAGRLGFGLEIFPLIVNGIGTVNITYGDIGIDAGGDAIVVGRNFGGDPLSNHNAAWRVSPVGEVFPVADLGLFLPGANQGAFAFDLTKEVREVTVHDVSAPPALPVLRLDGLRVNQDNCPQLARVQATLTNTGGADAVGPLRVYFFEGDPLGSGEVIGTALAPVPIAPNASVELSIEWPDPFPGVHEVFALAQGSNSPFLATMICVPAPLEEAIVLRPLETTLNVGDTHSLSASTFDLYGDPIPGLDLSFSINGANNAVGNATTDASGTAVFSYSGANAGQDTARASVFDEVSNAATVLWKQTATVLPVCIFDLAARSKDGKIQLTWSHTGAARYHVLRSLSQGGPYAALATTVSTYATYLDQELLNGITYFYVVREATPDGTELCRSSEVSATPRARRSRR